MSRRNTSPYSKRRQKVKKPDLNASPFKEELKNKRNTKIVAGLAILIVVVMVATLILPYFTGGSQKNYSLPNDVLVADESTDNVYYSAQNILLGQTYNRADEEYYVLFGKSEEISELTSKLTRENYYIVDSSNSANEALTKDVSKGKSLPQNPNDIKIKKDVALIKIEKGKATKFIDNKSDVTTYIDEITK